ncbi:MAG: PAS domain S-box protein [Proteobacteria bacterium]|nr:PAS domain S-box protein [Pseudomonadota bacterium]
MTNNITQHEAEHSLKDLHVLIIEDSEIDAELMVFELQRFGYTVTWQRVDNAESLREALAEKTWEIILSDYAIPQFSGLEALEIVKANTRDLPFILISGTIGEEIAVEAMRSGADDYLIKDRLVRLGMAVERGLREAKERKKLRQAEENLRKSVAYYRSIFNNSLNGIAITGLDLKFFQVNPAFCRLLEYTEDELIGKLCAADITHPEDIDVSKTLIMQLIRREIDHFVQEKRYITKSGKVIEAISFVNVIYDEASRYMASVISILDMTEHKRAEEQLRLAEFSIEHSGLATIWFDRNAHVVRVNKATCESLGYDREKLMQMTLHDFDPKFQSAETWEKSWEELKGHRRYGAIESQHRRKDGTIFPVEVLSSFCDFAGKEYIFSFIRDVTEQKRIEGALQRKSEEQTLLLESIPTQLWYLTDIETYGAVNKAHADFLGLSKDTMEGKKLNEFLLSHVAQKFMEGNRIVFETKKPIYTEEWVLNNRGEERILAITRTPKLDEKGEVEYVVCTANDITEYKKAEEGVRKSEEQFRALTENSYDTIMRFDRELRHVYVSPIVEKNTGIPRTVFIGKTLHELGFPEELITGWEETLKKVFETGAVQRMEFQLPLGAWIDWLCIPEFDSDGHVQAVITSARDITERKQAEEEKERLQAQFLHAQKMEAVGRLAGGVAHDFNNMLSVIIGYGELAKKELSPVDPLYLKVEQMLKAASKSADLTRQLLAFSRQQIIELKVLDLNKIIADSEKMLRRLLGEDIDLTFVPQTDLWPVKMDLSQIDQVLVNLAVNARDAIPDTGRLIIETCNTVLDEIYCIRHIGALPGDYIVLTVSDTGSGMDNKTLERLFEPFFTTKGEDKGTGLGLSTIFGIVKQNNGFIDVSSEPGIGTTFKIYFPRYQGEVVQEKERETPLALRGSETILVVEDEEQILAICRDLLNTYGYRVLAARQAGEAIMLCEKYQGDIHLLITDVVMPIMNGKELKERIEKMKPGILVLYMSGYTSDIIAHRGILTEGLNFIQKPFTINNFLIKVKETLEHR